MLLASIPQTTLLASMPQTTLEASTASAAPLGALKITEVPQTSEFASTVSMPHTTEVPHTASTPVKSHPAELSVFAIVIAPVVGSCCAVGDRAEPRTTFLLESAASTSRYPAPTVKR